MVVDTVLPGIITTGNGLADHIVDLVVIIALGLLCWTLNERFVKDPTIHTIIQYIIGAGVIISVLTIVLFPGILHLKT